MIAMQPLLLGYPLLPPFFPFDFLPSNIMMQMVHNRCYVQYLMVPKGTFFTSA